MFNYAPVSHTSMCCRMQVAADSTLNRVRIARMSCFCLLSDQCRQHYTVVHTQIRTKCKQNAQTQSRISNFEIVTLIFDRRLCTNSQIESTTNTYYMPTWRFICPRSHIGMHSGWLRCTFGE